MWAYAPDKISTQFVPKLSLTSNHLKYFGGFFVPLHAKKLTAAVRVTDG